MTYLHRFPGAMVAGLLLCLMAGLVHAIDNPDAPDYLTDFENRERPYRMAAESATTTTEIGQAWGAYEAFLDTELNAAYTQLMKMLDDRERMILRESQRKWLSYRDAEFDFIRDNWSREHFGSSAVLSRGAYRTDILRTRVRQLYAYLMNY